MQQTPETGVVVGISGLRFSDGIIAGRILPNDNPNDNWSWRRLCRACQSPETKKLLAEQLAALAAHAGDNVVYLDGAR